MILSNEFINICKLENFEWARNDLPDFSYFSDIVVEYYKSFSLSQVLNIFDEIDGNKGYLWLILSSNKKHDKSFDSMYNFYKSIRKIYFDKFFKDYENDVDTNNPTQIINKYVNIFSPIVHNKNYQKIVNTGVVMYRARIGGIEKVGTIDGLNVQFNYPWYGKDIINPPSSLASEGRFNREGFSYYYLSTKELGAIAEVRPEVGNFCTVAKFKIKANLKMFYFGCLNEIHDYLLKPVVNNKKHYRYTQFFSDIIINCGLDGIQYDGVQTGIYCVVCFNPNNVEYIKESEKLVKVNKADYWYSTFEPEFKKYENWKRMMPSDKTSEEETEQQFEYIIAHEQSGFYLQNEKDPIFEALKELDKLDE